MNLSDELKNRAHSAVKNPRLRQEIQSIASKEGVSFNEAMKRFYNKK